MGLFDPAWKKFHIKMCRVYEDLAIENHSGGPTNFIEITAKALVKTLPEFAEREALIFVESEYKSYTEFDIYPHFSSELLKRNNKIPENEIKEFFKMTKNLFLNKEKEHEYFLYFLISKIIEMKSLGINRYSYIIEITRGNKPKISGFFRRANQIAKYEMANDRIELRKES